MTTWADLLSALRMDLSTTSATKFTDPMLYQYACDAVRDYSLWFPHRVDRLALTLSGTSYPLPADFIDDIVVETPLDRLLEKRQETPGRRYLTVSPPSLYYIAGGNLYLNGTPDEGVYLTYSATHTLPASETDSTFVFTVPDADLELLRLYVLAKVHGQMRSKQSRLDRFDPGSGRRDDNPLKPEVYNYMNEYYDKIAGRVRGGAVKLFRPGRTR